MNATNLRSNKMVYCFIIYILLFLVGLRPIIIAPKFGRKQFKRKRKQSVDLFHALGLPVNPTKWYTAMASVLLLLFLEWTQYVLPPIASYRELGETIQMDCFTTTELLQTAVPNKWYAALCSFFLFLNWTRRQTSAGTCTGRG